MKGRKPNIRVTTCDVRTMQRQPERQRPYLTLKYMILKATGGR